MEQPRLYKKKSGELVCFLNKSLYGLHQSGREWNEHLNTILAEIRLKQCVTDPCVYVGREAMIGVYIDDMLLIGKLEQIKSVKEELQRKFKIKDLGEVSELLGLDISRPNTNEITIDQTNYIKSVLEEFAMENAKARQSPGVNDNDNIDDTSKVFYETIYRRATGRLQYLANCTRPDMSYTVNKLSKYCSRLTLNRWKEVKRVFRYSKG